MGSLEWDADANALYLRLNEENKKIVKTIPLNNNTYIDVTENNEPIGIEFISPSPINQEIRVVLSNLQSKLLSYSQAPQ